MENPASNLSTMTVQLYEETFPIIKVQKGTSLRKYLVRSNTVSAPFRVPLIERKFVLKGHLYGVQSVIVVKDRLERNRQNWSSSIADDFFIRKRRNFSLERFYCVSLLKEMTQNGPNSFVVTNLLQNPRTLPSPSLLLSTFGFSENGVHDNSRRSADGLQVFRLLTRELQFCVSMSDCRVV